jgi:hypothetical protein
VLSKKQTKQLALGTAFLISTVAIASVAIQTKYRVTLDGKETTAVGEMINGEPYIKASEVARLLGKSFRSDDTTFYFENGKIGFNLIKNPGFEEGPGIRYTTDDLVEIPQWSRELGKPQVAQYEDSEFQISEEYRPANCGKNYFAGAIEKGINTLTQSIKLDDAHLAAVQNGANFVFDAQLGGFEGHNDLITLTIEWLDKDQKSLGVVKIKPLTPEEREGITKFMPKTAKGKVPVGTAQARIKLSTSLNEGEWQDCYADNLSLKITN